ncbi:MAG: 30S ribosomal protein S18 [Fimbriimonadaceae bacterium]|nr:30S ribosomal protein S18 [Fimbriimonadaceae bacterium]QYK57172.1 MAG: 30S ribosomal protein S18 [Fimbriimonadaceae bacterium]
MDPLAEKAAVDDGRSEGRAKRKGRRKVSYLTVNKIENVDYKDVAILRRFLTDRGKILPSRQTGNTAKQQRMITRAIKRAREMALLPFVVTDISDEPRPARSRNYERGPRREEAESTQQSNSEE